MSEPLNYNYKESLQVWSRILKDESDARKRAELMLKEGAKRIGKDALVFDPILTCEALGEAELAKASELQAEAYKRIGMLWGKNYPALSLSIWRKAEKYYKESGQSQELDFLKLNLSLSCFLVGEKYAALDTIVAEKFRVEAGRIIQTVAEPQTDDYLVASFRYTKGTILRDAELLKQARFYYEQNGLWDAAIPCLDEEIRRILDSGNKLQALPLMERVKEYALKGGETAFAQMVDENMAHIDELQSGSRFMPLDADNLNIFDILDLLAYYEERVIFSGRYQAEQIAMGYESQEGRFVALANGKLMPTFRESFRVYRGESEFHADCKPTLWRKDMDDTTRFIERMKFVEFERALMKLPEYKCFRSGFPIIAPDGRVGHFTPNVDALGLAQHYGIKTEMMDVSADKWVAAFFACTKYNKADDTYSPIVESSAERGVIYNLPLHAEDFKKIRIVGAQPFERPTTQAAFMVEMKPEDDFNAISAEHTFFKHSAIHSLIVYHYANRCNRMFPHELIQKKTWEIINQEHLTFSPQTMEEARNRFKTDMDETRFQKVMKEINIDASATCAMPITDEEQQITAEHWLRHDSLRSKIDIWWYQLLDK